MKNHLKLLFIQAKVYDTRVNKVLVDGCAAVNLMPQSLLKKIGKCDIDLKPHKWVLSWCSPSKPHCRIYYETNLVHGGAIKSKL